MDGLCAKTPCSASSSKNDATLGYARCRLHIIRATYKAWRTYVTKNKSFIEDNNKTTAELLMRQAELGWARLS